MRQFHRIAGLVASLFLLVLVVTGLALFYVEPDATIQNGDWHSNGQHLFHHNQKIRLQYPGQIKAILVNPEIPNDVTVLTQDWWFRSTDGGQVFQAFPLPERHPGWFDWILAVHAGWVGKPFLSIIHQITAVITLALIMTGLWLTVKYIWVKKSLF